MRAFLVGLAVLGHGCAGPAATRAPTPLAGRSAAPEGAPAAVAKSVEGRVAIEPSGEWVDVVIEGSGEVSMDACTRMLGQATGPGARVTRACEARPLKPIGGHGVALVTMYDVDERAFALDDLLNGKQSAEEPPAFKGRRSGYEPHPSAASCDTEVARRNDNERRSVIEHAREVTAENDRRLAEATQAQDEACKRFDDASKKCVPLAGEAKKQCLLESTVSEMECITRKRQRESALHQRTVAPDNSMTNRRCVEY